ncbi:MAG TPA: phenylalanine--tRNA ligase subunit beta [Alphaproteobacteria bacterium]|nr:phenylalanine--tRNA ligase subunit beta [Alphaproteobacteria bacterium]
MKFTLGWLKAHLETTASLKEIADKLTAIGLELEGIEDRAEKLKPFIVAYVIEAKQHPDADRLRVCIVDTGTEKLQVVCGAPNARTGMKGVFARAGTTIPGSGLELKKSNIRGQESNGMLCSAREMGLGEDHAGIIDLPADAPVGKPFADVLGLNDPVIDIAITPNRADCLGVRGIARDLAAAGLGTLKPRKVEPVPGQFKSPVAVAFDLPPEAANACPYFVGRLIRGVKNGPSPKWLQDRLTAVGLRPISALVDVTNFFTLDVNRPLHVFDAKKIAGNKLLVRLAKPGETIKALNGKDYTLTGSETVICDDKGVESLGGVIGGETTGCTETTTDVFVEAALFDPIRTAATGRRHEIVSDARYRFERGLDPAAVIEGMEAATRLIMELCGGEPSELVITGKKPEWRRSYVLRTERLHGLGGLAIAAPEARQILERLGFAVDGSADVLQVTPPPWRGDIHGETDLIEEVARIHGYDKIAAVSMVRDSAVARPALTAAQRRVRDAKRELAGLGLVEAVTFSFMAKSQAALFGGANPALAVANPISADLDMMRPSILPNLVLAAKRNADRGVPDAALFEIGPQFHDPTPAGQRIVAAGIRSGRSGPRHWAAPPRPVDAFDAKADALALIAALGLSTDNVQVAADAPAWYHPGRSGALKLGPKTVLAYFGELHPGTLRKLDADGPTAAFEVFLDALPAPKAKASKARPMLRLSAFQPVERDFAFVIDAGIEAAKVVAAVKSAGKDLVAGAAIAAVSVFDVYQGQGVPEGKKSLAISVKLQPTERTLTDAEIEAVGQRIVASVAKATGASLRG